MLDILCIKGCIITIDAMGTHRDIAGKIIEKGADYVLQVNGSQPALMGDISLYFEKDIFTKPKKDLVQEGMYHKEMCNGHGRIETREYYVSGDIDWLLQEHSGWTGLCGIGACVASVTERDRTTKTISYSI